MKPGTRAVLDFLRVRGADGASEAEIQAATAIRSGAQRVHELRRDGYRIGTVYERSPIGARYARFVLDVDAVALMDAMDQHAATPSDAFVEVDDFFRSIVFRAVSGVQEGMAL